MKLERFETEIESVKKPKVNSIESTYPLEKLTPRMFEILVYHVFNYAKDELGEFDNVELMQGVAERGRDSILSFNGKSVGVIQCKHSQNVGKKYSVNEVGSEIVKFILHYIQDRTLITNLDEFTYFFTTNTSVNEDAKTLFIFQENFSTNYSPKIKQWIKNNLKKYTNLTLDNNIELFNEVLSVFSKLKLEKLTGVDLNKSIKIHERKITPLFFQVKLVADNSYVILIKDILEQLINPKLDFVIKNQKNKNFKKEGYKEAISKYLNSAIDNYSYVRTIIFGNNRQKLSDLYVPLTLYSRVDNQEFTIPSNTIDFLTNNKKTLISSTAGMGKSTVVKKIFIDVLQSKFGIPIFIELRRLTDKNSIVGEILNRLKPVYGKIDAKGLFAMVEQGNFIFIFDGFDEIQDKHKSKVIQKINDFISKTNKNNFIITSRPETALSTFADFKEFSIKDLEIEEAFDVLRNYGKSLEYSKELINKIKNEALESIREFLKNPLLVSLLYKAYEYKRRIPYKKHLFYSQVFDALYENHDLTKEGFTRDKKCKLDINNFQAVLRYIAYKTAIIRKTEYTKSELEELLIMSRSFTGLTFSSSDFVKDLISSVPLFTVEGNYYNWSHKSLQDYFAARFIQIDSSEKQNEIIEKIYNSRNCDRFDNILDILYDIDYKTFRNTILNWILDDYVEYDEDYYTKYNNIDELILNKRKALCFKRKILFLESKEDELNDDRSLNILKEKKTYNEEFAFRFRLNGKKGIIKSISHYQYYFLKFLMRKKNQTVISLNPKEEVTTIEIDLKESDPLSFELNDDKKHWTNRDKYNFKIITNLLNSHFKYRVNHQLALSERQNIKNDIRIKAQDDLLQFE